MKINQNKAFNGDSDFVMPCRMDLLSFIARDEKAGCRGQAREYLGLLREWFTEKVYEGLITDPKEWTERG